MYFVYFWVVAINIIWFDLIWLQISSWQILEPFWKREMDNEEEQMKGSYNSCKVKYETTPMDIVIIYVSI